MKIPHNQNFLLKVFQGYAMSQANLCQRRQYSQLFLQVEMHFGLLGRVLDELACLSLKQIIRIFKYVVQQGTFSVTARQQLDARGSRFPMTGSNAQKGHGEWHSPLLLKFSLSLSLPTAAQFTLLVICQWDAHRTYSTECSGILPLIMRWSQPPQPTPQWFTTI